MYDNVTASDVANEISMMRSAFKGTYIVVEGVTDSRLYGKFTEKDDVKIIIAHSKDNVRRSVVECRNNRRDMKTIGIIDPDLDRLRGKEHLPPIFATDKRDLESMIMCTRALDDILAEYADPEQLEEFEKAQGPVRDAVAKAAAPLGMLMYISQTEGLGLYFKDLEYRTFISKRSLGNDYNRMINEVLALSRSPRIGRKELYAKLCHAMEELEDPWLAVRGHDAVAILAIGLDEIFGSYNSRGIKDGQLGGSLRLAFSYDDFADTELYRDTSDWSRKTENPLWLSR
ncbi:MAG: DUF4435 domain-containing protein [Candidatus Methanomethylophilaceae archaeon]|jgi:hypothetical protein